MIEAGQYNLQVPQAQQTPQRDSMMSGFSNHRFSAAMASPTMSTFSSSGATSREYGSDNGPASPPMYQAPAGQMGQMADQKSQFASIAPMPSPTTSGTGGSPVQAYYEMHAEHPRSFPAELPAEMPAAVPPRSAPGGVTDDRQPTHESADQGSRGYSTRR